MSTAKVPFLGNDRLVQVEYPVRMASRPTHDWYLKEWLGSLNVSIAKLESETGWTHRIANQLVNRKTRWNRDHLALATQVLRLRPYELLMHPDDAMAIRKLMADAGPVAELGERLKLVSDRTGTDG
jgi:hypothetical protein